MIEIKQNDIVYKLPTGISTLRNVTIPENATVFDASGCRQFYDLEGLRQYPNLRVLLLKETAIDSLDFCYIPENIKEQLIVELYSK